MHYAIRYIYIIISRRDLLAFFKMLLTVQLNITILVFSDIKSIVCRLSSTLSLPSFTLDCLKPMREMQFLLGSYSPSIMPMIYWSMFFNVSF